MQNRIRRVHNELQTVKASIDDREACFESCDDARDEALAVCERLPFREERGCRRDVSLAYRQCKRACRSDYRHARNVCLAEVRACRADCR